MEVILIHMYFIISQLPSLYGLGYPESDIGIVVVVAGFDQRSPVHPLAESRGGYPERDIGVAVVVAGFDQSSPVQLGS